MVEQQEWGDGGGAKSKEKEIRGGDLGMSDFQEKKKSNNPRISFALSTDCQIWQLKES